MGVQLDRFRRLARGAQQPISVTTDVDQDHVDRTIGRRRWAFARPRLPDLDRTGLDGQEPA